MADGRFAPSPTGPLHLGNLRTALVAWLFSRSSGGRFVVRMEDLDRANASSANEERQLGDLAAIGLDWDGEVVRQSDRFALYDAAIDRLAAAGLTYRCYCTRREIAEAASAPHGLFPEGAYPGTCRSLTDAECAEREAAGRRPAVRLRSDGEIVSFVDRLCGSVSIPVDDVVLRRNDGVPAYNLAVVVDDAAQRIDEVVRGDDLLTSTPRQIHLQRLLGVPTPAYAHVPLVLGPDGQRLAKRHGAVTLSDRAAGGQTPADVVTLMARSLQMIATNEQVSTAVDLLPRFDPDRLPRGPWRIDQ
ncbi:MAG: tRNA glutamyl-Q(34) synthetase GluQRS [Acidimicrobiia bacterium]